MVLQDIPRRGILKTILFNFCVLFIFNFSGQWNLLPASWLEVMIQGLTVSTLSEFALGLRPWFFWISLDGVFSGPLFNSLFGSFLSDQALGHGTKECPCAEPFLNHFLYLILSLNGI